MAICVCLFSDNWTPRRSASSGSVLDNVGGQVHRLSQAADPSLFRVPSESTVQTEATSVPAPPAPPLPAVNSGGLVEALRSTQLRKTSKVLYLFGYFQLLTSGELYELEPSDSRTLKSVNKIRRSGNQATFGGNAFGLCGVSISDMIIPEKHRSLLRNVK